VSADQYKQVEVVTAERVERGRARLLALAEQFLDAANAALSQRDTPPPKWLSDLWDRLLMISPTDAAGRLSVAREARDYVVRVRAAFPTCATAAAECFQAAVTGWSPSDARVAEAEVEWSSDPAASDPQSRTWFGGGWEATVYDDGDWELRGPPAGCALIGGSEVSVDVAKRRAIAVYGALRLPWSTDLR
jgi:hypothetical protein